jgi:hypothetical protein
VRVAQTPVVVNIPEARVDAVDDSKGDVNCFGGSSVVQTVNAKRCIEQDSGSVLSTVQQMGKLVTSVPVSAKTLQQPPYAGQCRKKAGDAQMRRVALRWVVPIVCIQTKEQSNTLLSLVRWSREKLRKTYTHAVCQ